MFYEKESPYKGELEKASPFPNIGRLRFTGEDEGGHNLLVRFAEEICPKIAIDDVSIKFTPTSNDLNLWVCSKTPELVSPILEDIIAFLRGGFYAMRIELTERVT